MMTVKRMPQGSGPDFLLPIDEDVDDEKCSPIKPKKRTAEDSPFKRNLINLVPQIHEEDLDRDMPLIISSDEDIAVGGFGVDLDDRVVVDLDSFNLNSGLNSSPLRNNSSPNKKEKANVDSFFDQDLSGVQSQGVFQLEIEKVAMERGHFENIDTINSGGANSSTNAIGTKMTTQLPSRNHPSLNPGSLSGQEEMTTLQLDTIAPIRPIAPSSTKNIVLNKKDGQM